MTDNSYDAWIDGQSASAADLASLAFAGFAHFTAMQIRDGRVKGLDLHLERLRTASLELFGKAVPDALVRERIRSAIPKERADLSLTVTMFSRAGEFTPIGASDDPAILVRTSPAFDGPDGPLRLTLVEHERWLPTIKQVGEAAKTHYLREAVSRGFDDAAFIDRAGRISEATIWNMAFWDGEAVVWPVADVLPGVTMSIIRRQLKALGITQRDMPINVAALKAVEGAAVMNSWSPGIAIKAIGATEIPTTPVFPALLRQAYRAEPAVEV